MKSDLLPPSLGKNSNSAANSPSGSPHTPSVTSKGTIPLSHAPGTIGMHPQSQSLMYGASQMPMGSPIIHHSSPAAAMNGSPLNTAFPFNHTNPIANHYSPHHPHHSPSPHFHSYSANSMFTTPPAPNTAYNHLPRPLPPYVNNPYSYSSHQPTSYTRNYPHSPSSSQMRNFQYQLSPSASRQLSNPQSNQVLYNNTKPLTSSPTISKSNVTSPLPDISSSSPKEDQTSSLPDSPAVQHEIISKTPPPLIKSVQSPPVVSNTEEISSEMDSELDEGEQQLFTKR